MKVENIPHSLFRGQMLANIHQRAPLAPSYLMWTPLVGLKSGRAEDAVSALMIKIVHLHTLGNVFGYAPEMTRQFNKLNRVDVTGALQCRNS